MTKETDKSIATVTLFDADIGDSSFAITLPIPKGAAIYTVDNYEVDREDFLAVMAARRTASQHNLESIREELDASIPNSLAAGLLDK